jgi:acyl-homoserine-lactone acylase
MLWLALALSGCTNTDDADTDGTPSVYDVEVGPYDTQIRYTEYGIPHIQAADHGSLGYGLGYAQAVDHGCVLMDQINKVRGERARFFGPGPDDRFVDEDFGWKAIDALGSAERLWPELEPIFQQTLIGFAAGVSRWVEEDALPAACDGDPRVRPLTHIDVLTYILALGVDGSSKVWVREIGQAEPPRVSTPSSARAPVPGIDRLADISAEIYSPKRGSNGWAIGSDRSANGRGMLLSNTHFPHLGEKQWHEAHLTIPGELDVYGVSLVGVPVINMGFTQTTAWTHTVSFSPRFVVYLLELEPGDPTSYLFDGEYRAMESFEVEVEVEGESPRTRTLYRSHYGPILNAPLLGWTESLAVTFRDVNTENLQMFDVWYGMQTAASVEEFETVHRESAGTPWVYTIAAFDDGRVYFGDASRVPYLSDAAIEGWQNETDFFLSQFRNFGVIGVDGSDPLYTWVEDPDAAVPGVVPYDLAPTDVRTDYVFNANDSHWLHNVDAPLTGYSRLFGEERTPRSGRTRMNGRFLSETGPGTASGDDGAFTLDELEAAALSMRSILAEDALPGVVERCTATPTGNAGGQAVDLTDACATLAAWDGRFTRDAVGAILWREFLGGGTFDVFDIDVEGGGLFTVPFDPDTPVDTPNTVVAAPADGNDPILDALAEAVVRLQSVGLDHDTALGDAQFLAFPDPPIGVGGGQYWEGTIGIADYSPGATTTQLPRYTRDPLLNDTTELTENGEYPVNNGNSWVMAMEFGEDGPEARAVMTYSQSEDPASPHYADQSVLYSDGQLRDIRFTEADIAAHTVETLQLTLP